MVQDRLEKILKQARVAMGDHVEFLVQVSCFAFINKSLHQRRSHEEHIDMFVVFLQGFDCVPGRTVRAHFETH
jgi:hypothetical protein